MNYGKSINSIGCVKISEIVRRDWRESYRSQEITVIDNFIDHKVYKRRLRERLTRKYKSVMKNDINDLHLTICTVSHGYEEMKDK